MNENDKVLMLRKTASILIMMLLLAILMACTRKKGPEINGVSIGTKAPDFSSADLSGNRVSLRDFGGKNLLINFWATWCYPCREEMDDLKSVSDQYRDRGIVVIGIDMKERKEIVKQFTDSMNITYPILLDADGKIGEAYNIFGVPSSFFIDRNGIIRDIVLGEMEEDTITSKIENLGFID